MPKLRQGNISDVSKSATIDTVREEGMKHLWPSSSLKQDYFTD